jgi:uncharacterized membrane protein YccC
MKADYRHRIITAISCWLATMAACALHFSDPWWATITAWVIAHPNPSQIWQKGALRVGGTIAGCVLGFVLAGLTLGSPLLQSVALFSVMALGTYLRLRSNYEYAWILGTVSVLLLVSLSLQEPGTLYQAAHFRAYEIICGVVAATVGPVLLRPVFGLSPQPASSAGLPTNIPGDQAETWRVAIVGGVGVVAIAVIWAVLNLPSLAQSMITAVIVLNRDVATSRARARLRIAGCLLGGAAGIVCVLLISDSFPVWSILLLLGLAGFARLHLSEHRWAYVGTQGGIAFIIAMVSGNGPPASVGPVVNRLAGITIGVLVMQAVAAGALLFAASGRSSRPRALPADLPRISV